MTVLFEEVTIVADSYAILAGMKEKVILEVVSTDRAFCTIDLFLATLQSTRTYLSRYWRQFVQTALKCG
jgi:hypothetical protein